MCIRMRGLKMAELKFEAPLAKFENEDWNEYNEFQGANNFEKSDFENSNKRSTFPVNMERPDNVTNEHFVEQFSGSLEDLVNTFDEKITKCFCNFEEKVEKFAPVQIRSQEEIMNDCQMWWTITGNYGNILPIDWSKSYAKQLQTKVLNLEEIKECVSPNLSLSDDEELTQAFDMHSMIVHTLSNSDPDHVATADEVIDEIENMMMQDTSTECSSTDPDTPVESSPPFTSTLPPLPSYSESEMKQMSSKELNEVLAEYELTIKEFSETLVHELALRDELEYDKELKNQFISLLLTIQKRRRESNADKKKKKVKSSNNNNNNNNSPVENGPSTASTFLTTVIPYHTFEGPPTSEQLQIYIKILQAINEDSPTVPTLLTDYILKVLCPT